MKDWNGVEILPGQRVLYKTDDTWQIRTVEQVASPVVTVSGPDLNDDPTAMLRNAPINLNTDAVPNRFILVVRDVDGSTSVPGHLIRRERYPAPLGWIPP